MIALADTEQEDSESLRRLQEMKDLMAATLYADYLAKWDAYGVKPGTDVVKIEGEKFSPSNTTATIETYTVDGIKGLLVPDTGKVSWDFTIKNAGYYNVVIEYYPIHTKYKTARNGLYIEGEYLKKGNKYYLVDALGHEILYRDSELVLIPLVVEATDENKNVIFLNQETGEVLKDISSFLPYEVDGVKQTVHFDYADYSMLSGYQEVIAKASLTAARDRNGHVIYLDSRGNEVKNTSGYQESKDILFGAPILVNASGAKLTAKPVHQTDSAGNYLYRFTQTDERIADMTGFTTFTDSKGKKATDAYGFSLLKKKVATIAVPSLIHKTDADGKKIYLNNQGEEVTDTTGYRTVIGKTDSQGNSIFFHEVERLTPYIAPVTDDKGNILYDIDGMSGSAVDVKGFKAHVDQGGKAMTDAFGNAKLISEDGKTIATPRLEFKKNANGKYIYLTDSGEQVTETQGYDVAYGEEIGKSSTIERAILFDGSYPFKESRYVAMMAKWQDAYQYGEGTSRGFDTDKYGNELRPTKYETPAWMTTAARDSTGYYLEPFRYYLAEGTHTITFQEVTEPVVIGSITIQYVKKPVDYDAYLSSMESAHKVSKDDRLSNVKNIRVDAETPLATSGQILYALNDRSSAATDPQDSALQRLNTIGGEKWVNVGDWIQWAVEIPANGWYYIVPRSKQAIYEGMYTSRELRIDGEVPFAEASSLRFNYSDTFRTDPLNDGKTNFMFYLTKGKHEIELRVVLGDMAQVLRIVDNVMVEVNKIYMKILMLTGPAPDEYRDYKFASQLPDVLEAMKKQSNILKNIYQKLEEITGSAGSHSVTLNKVQFLLERMYKDEDIIAANFSTLKDYISSLGTWISETSNQPLEVDYIEFAPVGNELPKAESNFFGNFFHEIKSFVASFYTDYNNLGAKELEDGKEYQSITVWISTGRDQAQIIRSMIQDEFTTQHEIAVNLELVAGGALLPSTLAGIGPDVALSIGSGTIINYAIRSAVVPITGLSEFDETTKRFHATAMVPLTLYGESYALPETQLFSMIFYRKDIFSELDLTVPETWDDLYDIIPIFENNHLDMGFAHSYTMFMYQQEERLYKGELKLSDEVIKALEDNGYKADDIHLTSGMKINLDSNVALAGWKKMCELFTMYGFPVTFNFANRFKTGEMPLAMTSYSAYGQLTIFAPEIRGLWEFTLVPGTMDEETGIVNHDIASGVTGVMMMKGAVDHGNVEPAWTFMKWWTDTDAQARYGNELLALLGASGRHDTANLDALARQPWPASDYNSLREQFQHLAATPELPGGYIIGRYTNFAFLAAYNDNEVPTEALLKYIDAINNELSRKREEFNLPTFQMFEHIEELSFLPYEVKQDPQDYLKGGTGLPSEEKDDTGLSDESKETDTQE